MEYSLKDIGKKIGSRRREIGLNQAQLAERVHISNTHLSNIERGKKPPGFMVFLDICNELKVGPEYLTSGKIYTNVDEEIIDKMRLCSAENKIIISKIIDVFL